MSGVASLKGIDCICILRFEFFHEFRGGLAPLIQSIVVCDTIQQFHITANQVVTTLVNLLDVGVSHVNDSKHTSDNFFFAIVVDFGLA